MDLNKKVVVITGGSQGFGKALAELLVSEAAIVHIVSKNKENIEGTAKEIQATSHIADVREEQALRSIARDVFEKAGAIDIWINCAGVFRIFPKNELIDMRRAHEMFDVNFFGSVFGSRTALAHMKDRSGIIINVLSTAALDATRAKNAKLYAASKWALRGWIDAFRNENRELPIKILSVYPGGMKSHLHDEAIPEDFENFMQPAYVAKIVIENLKSENPQLDLIIKRPGV